MCLPVQTTGEGRESGCLAVLGTRVATTPSSVLVAKLPSVQQKLSYMSSGADDELVSESPMTPSAPEYLARSG